MHRIITAAAIALALTSAGCAEYEPALIDGLCGPIVMPLTVVDDGSDLPPGMLPRAAEAWNDASPTLALCVLSDVELEPHQDGVAYVSTGYLPGGVEELDDGEWVQGQAGLHLSADGVSVAWCEVTVSSEILYDDELTFSVLLHEVGHCFGLADGPWGVRDGDPGVMREPVRAGDRPSELEAAVVVAGCTED